MRRAEHGFRRQSDFPLETTATFGRIPGVAWSDHSAQDTPEKLDHPRLAALTWALARTCVVLADDEGL
jgi:hypothetical protein